MHSCRHRLGPDQRQPSRASTDARSPAPSEPRPAPTWPQPTVTRSQGARHTAPPPAPLGLRFRALLGLGFVPPPEPRPCASIAYALLPAARVPLCRHRADPESSSRSLPSGSPARLARIAPTACRHPHPSMSPPSRSRTHRPPIAPTVRRHPHRAPSLSSRCGGPRALTGKNRAVCIPFSPNARKRPPSWQHPPEMHAFRDQNGNILAPCIHSRVQSGDLGYMARESCRQGPFFASRSPKSRMARRCCQRRPAFPRQRLAVRRNGLCAMRQRHAARGMAERALRPAARAWPACRMRPPCHLACVRRGLRPLPSRPRSSPPSYARRASPPASRPPRPAIRRAAHCGRGEPPIGLFLLPSCCPRRRIAPTDARSPAPPDPHTLAPTDARSLAPPEPQPEPTEPCLPVELSAPIRAPPPAAPHPAARVPLRFR